MAMTMTSTMPSSEGVARRHDAPALPSRLQSRRRSAGAAFPGGPVANGDLEEEKSEVQEEPSLARSSRRFGSVRFAQFDDELEDSDQTITGFGRPPRAQYPLTHRRLEQQQTLTNMTRSKSTFFPDSTDDEDLSASRISNTPTISTTKAQPPLRQTPTPTYPVMHIGDVQFPMTRTVLWDRRVLAGPYTLRTADVLPRVRLSNRVLKQLHAQLIQDNKTSTKKYSASAPRRLAYACGSPCRDESSAAVVVLSQLEHHQPDRSATVAHTWCIPCYRHTPDEAARAQRALIDALQASFVESTSRTVAKHFKASNYTLPLYANAIVSLASDRSRAEIDVEMECAVPQINLEWHLIRTLPTLMTPLAASLLRCEFGHDSLRYGFLTLDRARKAVPLLETDPLVLQRPIVGVWIYGVPINTTDSRGEAVQVMHPYILQSCVKFIASKTIKERAQVDPATFLVAVYPGRNADPLPRFFECRVLNGERSRQGLSVEWSVAHARNRCLAGASSFTGDLELTLSPSSESMVHGNESEQRLAPAPLSPQHSSIHSRAAPPLSHHASFVGRAPQERVLASREAPQPTKCCESHELLVKQHQELFDMQQRQLSDLQRQIAELQRVLSETRAENSKLLAAASSAGSSIAPEDKDGEQDANNDEGMEQEDRTDCEEDAVNEHHDDGGATLLDEDNDASQLSSLALSSISHDSNLSDLSSISSSLVGIRLQSILGSEDDQPASADAAESPLEDDDADHGQEAGVCPYTPVGTKTRRPKSQHAQCERDEVEDEEDASTIQQLLAERLQIPSTPNREEIVRSGSLSTFGFTHGGSFSIPRIKFVPDPTPTCDSDEDDEEEIRRIELKYRKRAAK